MIAFNQKQLKKVIDKLNKCQLDRADTQKAYTTYQITKDTLSDKEKIHILEENLNNMYITIANQLDFIVELYPELMDCIEHIQMMEEDRIKKNKNK
ncbi:hypothetical protein [Francisella philomiragia]|uniref:hypothetical protein n=1 Tax=Francisella philomiragia TaxID=28110 RepID=UPI001C9DF2A6|nr:hypothetical protein [Francisella philomiragia]MBY7733494.1 hypothetical protein [Francisella philomiragia]